jgi:RNA polymerase sigma-70 factor (ECF subfamily)
MSDLLIPMPHGLPIPPSLAGMAVATPRRERVRLHRMSEPAQKMIEVDYAALIQAVAGRHDRDAFATLFRHFAPRVKAWMLRAGTADAAAEELAQEAMLVVWRKAALFDPSRAGAATWIFTIARNLRIDALRRKTHPSTLLTDPADQPDNPAPADHLLVTAERDDRLRAALAHLPSEQADVVRLAFFQDKPHAEIERDLGIPLGTVKSRLRLAMVRLRSMLGDFA